MSDTHTIDYEARVAKGIALLDEKFPDWAAHIDPETVDIFSNDHCCTAQLAQWQMEDPDADFRDGMVLLGLKHGARNDGSYTLHGFNAEVDDAFDVPPGYDQNEAYAILNRIWKWEIAARRSTAS